MNQDREPGVNMSSPDSLPGYLGFDEAVSEAELRILPKDTEFAKKRYVGSAAVDVSCEIVLRGAAKSIVRRYALLHRDGRSSGNEIPITLANSQSRDVRVLTIGRKEGGKAILDTLFIGTSARIGPRRITLSEFS